MYAFSGFSKTARDTTSESAMKLGGESEAFGDGSAVKPRVRARGEREREREREREL